MASNTEYLPDEITYGFVADRVLLAVGDTTSDDNRYPDGVPAQGTVRFSPERTILYTQDTPATVLPRDIECTIYHRDHPVAVNNGYEPELVGKLVDPAGHVGNVALIVGWYDVVYRLSTGTAQRFRFQVKPEHTADNPLWLPEVAPLQPTPSERFVVNEQVYNDTKEARDEAEQYRNEAQEAFEKFTWPVQVQDTPPENTDVIWVNPDEPAGTASDWALRAEAAAATLGDVGGLHVDTSVGTRVFVGDTMIHGDTGTRDVGYENVKDGAQTVFMRRVGEAVYAYGDTAPIPNSGNIDVAPVPVGFRPRINARFVYSEAGEHPEKSLVALRSGNIRAYGKAANGRVQFHAVWDTDDAWPTTLPGSPA